MLWICLLLLKITQGQIRLNQLSNKKREKQEVNVCGTPLFNIYKPITTMLLLEWNIFNADMTTHSFGNKNCQTLLRIDSWLPASTNLHKPRRRVTIT